MNRQRTFHFRLFENLQDFFFKHLKNTLKTYNFLAFSPTFLGIFQTFKEKILEIFKKVEMKSSLMIHVVKMTLFRMW